MSIFRTTLPGANGRTSFGAWIIAIRQSTTDGGLAISFDPANLNIHLFSGFAQDEIAVVRDRLYLTAGTKARAQLLHRLWRHAEHPRRMAAQCAPDPVGGCFESVAYPCRFGCIEPQLNYRGIHRTEWHARAARLWWVIQTTRMRCPSIMRLGYRATLSKRLSVDLTAYYDRFGRSRDK